MTPAESFREKVVRYVSEAIETVPDGSPREIAYIAVLAYRDVHERLLAAGGADLGLNHSDEAERDMLLPDADDLMERAFPLPGLEPRIPRPEPFA